mgnify:FL=1
MSSVRADTAMDAGVSPTVQSIFERILATIHDGGLRPGTTVRDTEIARELGMSRTPVREAFQMLREAGVLEVSASRFTRIAVISPDQTEQAARAWLALFSIVLDGVVAAGPHSGATIAELETDHAEAVAGTIAFDNPRVAAANARLFSTAVLLSDNPYLVKAVASVAHVLRLGMLSLPSSIDLSLLLRAQRETIDAIRDGDRESAARAIASLSAITIPRV